MKRDWILIFILSLILILPQAGFSMDAVRIFLFYSGETMKVKLEEEIVRPLSNKYPIEVQSFSVNELKNYDLLTKFEKELKITNNELPTVIIGEKFLGGEVEIRKGLEGLIKFHVQRGGSPWPSLKKVQEGEANCTTGSQGDSLSHNLHSDHLISTSGLGGEGCFEEKRE